MRINNPVTQVERPLPPGKTIVSKTDLKGRITEANDAFVEVSGFGRDELVGQPHNIVRHPDVPAEVFAHMWRTLESGRPWRGVVKNRCKNGDHYWVDAYVVPLRRRGETIGYMSARSAPTREQIRQAEAQYEAIENGAPVARSSALANFLSVRRGVLAGILFVFVSIVVGALIGLGGLDRSSMLVYELQRYNDVAAMVARNNQAAADSHADLLLALQHADGSGGSDNLDLAAHRKQIAAALVQLDMATSQLADQRSMLRKRAGAGQAEARSHSELTANEAALDRYVKASRRLRDEALAPVAQLLEAGRFAEAQHQVVDLIGPRMAALNSEAAVVSRGLFAASLELRRSVDDLYERTVDRTMLWSGTTVLLVVLCGIVFFRGTIHPLTRAVESIERVAEGRLRDPVEVFGFAEPGQVVDAVARMQVQLRVMLDDILGASQEVGAQVERLNRSVVALVDSTEDQYRQAVQINESLVETGADTGRLAECAGAAYECARRLTESGQPPTSAELEELRRLTNESASLAQLNAFAATEIQRLSGRILALVAENREISNDAWGVGQNLDQTSARLKGMIEKFE